MLNENQIGRCHLHVLWKLRSTFSVELFILRLKTCQIKLTFTLVQYQIVQGQIMASLDRCEPATIQTEYCNHYTMLHSPRSVNLVHINFETDFRCSYTLKLFFR